MSVKAFNIFIFPKNDDENLDLSWRFIIGTGNCIYLYLCDKAKNANSVPIELNESKYPWFL